MVGSPAFSGLVTGLNVERVLGEAERERERERSS